MIKVAMVTALMTMSSAFISQAAEARNCPSYYGGRFCYGDSGEIAASYAAQSAQAVNNSIPYGVDSRGLPNLAPATSEPGCHVSVQLVQDSSVSIQQLTAMTHDECDSIKTSLGTAISISSPRSNYNQSYNDLISSRDYGPYNSQLQAVRSFGVYSGTSDAAARNVLDVINQALGMEQNGTTALYTYINVIGTWVDGQQAQVVEAPSVPAPAPVIYEPAPTPVYTAPAPTTYNFDPATLDALRNLRFNFAW
jgi:hypothetical protein